MAERAVGKSQGATGLQRVADALVQHCGSSPLDGDDDASVALREIRDAVDRAVRGAKAEVAVEVKALWKEVPGGEPQPRCARPARRLVRAPGGRGIGSSRHEGRGWRCGGSVSEELADQSID